MISKFNSAVEEAVNGFYRHLLNKNCPTDELRYWSKKLSLSGSFKEIYESLCVLKKQLLQNNANLLPITLAIFAKNNEDSIHLPIQSVYNLVSEIILVDTGSTDNTIKIAEKLGAKVYKVGFSDFGSIRTLTVHLSTQPWILGLDSDEILCPEEVDSLRSLVYDTKVDVWGLPRRRWADIDMKNQVEKEAYPDYQYRLIRNNKEYYYSNRVHERLVCKGACIKKSEYPHIEHFQDVFKFGDKLKARNNFYKSLYDLDIKDGFTHSIPPVSSVDEVK